MKINVRHIAKLANLELRDDEIPKFESQLSSILEYVKKLQEIDLDILGNTSSSKSVKTKLSQNTAQTEGTK